MKTALDLPDELMKEVKVHAVMHGRKLKDEIAELLRRGLAADPQLAVYPSPTIAVDAISGLPMIQCRHIAAQSEQLTPERVATILLDQEIAWNHDAGR